jgi:methyltransferase (TIGR00027 family)
LTTAQTVNPNLAATAYWTAAARALESSRDDRLFHDPWAATLAGSPGQEWIAGRAPGSVLPIVLRTRFYDDFLHQTTAETPIRQVVLLAAGLDTRPYRIQWPPGTHWFEMDQSAVLSHKASVLEASGARAACDLHAVPADLATAWEPLLACAGYDREKPSVWLLEGFLFYLQPEVLKDLLQRVLRLAVPGSRVGFDLINSLVLTHPATKGWVEMQASSGAPWTGYLDDPQEFLAERGWMVTLTAVGAPEANYGRWTLPVIPAVAPGLPHLWFVTAEKN